MFVNDQSGLVFLQMFLVQFWDGIPTMKSTRKLYIGFYGFLWKQGDHLISHKIGFNHQTRGLDPRTNRIQQQIICEKCWGYAGVLTEFNQQKSGVDQERGFHCRCYGRNKTCLSGNGGIDMDLQEWLMHLHTEHRGSKSGFNHISSELCTTLKEGGKY